MLTPPCPSQRLSRRWKTFSFFLPIALASVEQGSANREVALGRPAVLLAQFFPRFAHLRAPRRFPQQRKRCAHGIRCIAGL